MNTYYNPVRTFQGEGCVKKIAGLLDTIPMKSQEILVLTWHESVNEMQDVKNLVEEKQAYHFRFYNFTKANPETTDLMAIYEETKEWNIGLVIGIGGGSVLDVAKSLCCLYDSKIETETQLVDAVTKKQLITPACPWIGIPTTAGTGSEVTCWATIWNPKEGSKLSLESQENYAYAAFIDNQFTTSMSIQLTVSSALDALAHATESYWAKGSNVVSRALALQSISTIVQHLDWVFDEGRKKEGNYYLAQGSMLAGLAFSNTKTTACHSISYPLTLNYGIPHGVAVSMLLGAVMEVNQAMVNEMELLLHAYEADSVQEVTDKVKGFMKKAGIISSLKEWGVVKEELEALACQGATKGRIDNNPVELTANDIATILYGIYE